MYTLLAQGGYSDDNTKTKNMTNKYNNVHIERDGIVIEVMQSYQAAAVADNGTHVLMVSVMSYSVLCDKLLMV